MPAIVTVTINPTIDKSTSISALVPEKKLRCEEPTLEPGGGGVNVARAIRKLGGDALAVFLAGGYPGKLLTQLLDAEGVPSLPVQIQRDTRENVIILDIATNQQYRFGMPGPKVEDSEWQECLNQIDSLDDVEYLVASGSLSPGVPENIFAKLAAIAKKKRAKFIVDTSGKALSLAVHEGVYLLKPNLAELASIAGKDELTDADVVETARQIISSGNCEVIIASMGAAGAMLITADDVCTVHAPSVKRKSTVGAGDSMVGGVVLSLSRGMNLQEAARYGVAAGTAATMNSGTELCKLEDVEKLYQTMNT